MSIYDVKIKVLPIKKNVVEENKELEIVVNDIINDNEEDKEKES